MADCYHGIIINQSQRDQSIYRDLPIIGRKRVALNWLVLYKVEVPADAIEAAIQKVQANLKDVLSNQFYCHFYRENELIVVFKEKVFRITPDQSTWAEAIAYGVSIKIPEKQLDFFPCRVEDERF
jgi:hypothetical protein